MISLTRGVAAPGDPPRRHAARPAPPRVPPPPPPHPSGRFLSPGRFSPLPSPGGGGGGPRIAPPAAPRRSPAPQLGATPGCAWGCGVPGRRVGLRGEGGALRGDTGADGVAGGAWLHLPTPETIPLSRCCAAAVAEREVGPGRCAPSHSTVTALGAVPEPEGPDRSGTCAWPRGRQDGGRAVLRAEPPQAPPCPRLSRPPEETPPSTPVSGAPR